MTFTQKRIGEGLNIVVPHVIVEGDSIPRKLNLRVRRLDVHAGILKSVTFFKKSATRFSGYERVQKKKAGEMESGTLV